MVGVLWSFANSKHTSLSIESIATCISPCFFERKEMSPVHGNFEAKLKEIEKQKKIIITLITNYKQYFPTPYKAKHSIVPSSKVEVEKLSEGDWNQIICHAELVQCQKGDVILDVESLNDALYRVQHGSVDVVTKGKTVLTACSRGFVFGEMSVVASDARASGKIQVSSEKAEIMRLPVSSLARLAPELKAKLFGNIAILIAHRFARSCRNVFASSRMENLGSLDELRNPNPPALMKHKTQYLGDKALFWAKRKKVAGSLIVADNALLFTGRFFGMTKDKSFPFKSYDFEQDGGDLVVIWKGDEKIKKKTYHLEDEESAARIVAKISHKKATSVSFDASKEKSSGGSSSSDVENPLFTTTCSTDWTDETDTERPTMSCNVGDRLIVMDTAIGWLYCAKEDKGEESSIHESGWVPEFVVEGLAVTSRKSRNFKDLLEQSQEVKLQAGEVLIEQDNPSYSGHLYLCTEGTLTVKSGNGDREVFPDGILGDLSPFFFF